MTVHEIIKKRLKERGNTMDDLFTHLGFSRQRYGKAMKDGTIKLNQLEAIANFLAIPLPELLLPAYYEPAEIKLIESTILYVRSRVGDTKDITDKTDIN